MEIKNLADNLGLDVEDVNELLELYIETTSADLNELKAALDAGNAEEAHQKSHSIKGSSGNLGLNELYEAAKEIDDRARANSLNGLDAMVQTFQEKYEKLVQGFRGRQKR
ncbi:MAG: Hpt domain-containing protein [Deltaproteobacteria bacterium]|nr:Hpt domain-containing protein [Deltaproteobacteria bacterium]